MVAPNATPGSNSDAAPDKTPEEEGSANAGSTPASTSAAPQGTPKTHYAEATVFLSVCSVGFLIADLCAAPLFDSAIPALVVLNIVVAQLTLICVWGTLVRGAFWVRLPWTLFLLTVSWGFLCWGLHLSEFLKEYPFAIRQPINQMLGLGLLWFYGFLVSFIPLKIAAALFRWQIIHPSSEKATAQYAIRDMMVGTGLLAASLGLGRLLLPDQSPSWHGVLVASGLGEMEPLFAIIVYSFASLLVKLPCIWIALASPTERLWRHIGLWSPYCLLLTITEYVILVSVLGPGGDGEVFWGMIIGHQLMGGAVFAVLIGLRRMGYRLERALQ